MRRAMVVGAAIGFLALIAVNAQAGTIVLNGSTVLFDSGGYENDTPGTNPGSVTAGTSWVTEYSADRIDTYGPSSGGPGACTGNNYLRFYRGLSEDSFKNDYYWNGWSSPNPVAEGNTLKVEYAVYVDSLGGAAISGDGTAFHTSFSNTSDGWFAERVTWTSLTFPDHDVWVIVGSPSVPAGHVFGCYYDGGWKALTSKGSLMTVAADAWHTIAIDLTVGTGYTVTLDGVTSDPVAMEPGLSDYTVQSFKFWSNSDARNGESLFYLDAVPEPSPPGDANGDGRVDDLDASILAANWQRTGGAAWAQADFNADGNVNDLDASILAANWQYGVGAAVPEPATLALLLSAPLTLSLAWRRRSAR